MGKGTALKGFVKPLVDDLLREVPEARAKRGARGAAKGGAKGGAHQAGRQSAERAGREATERGGREAAERSGKGSTKPGVREHEVSSYRDLNNRAKSHDGMEHDHIPSAAALEKAEEKRLGRPLTKAEKRQVKNDGTTVAVKNEDHAESRTYRGRNTPEQIEADSADLAKAQESDLATMRDTMTERGFSPEKIEKTLDNIRAQNQQRGIG